MVKFVYINIKCYIIFNIGICILSLKNESHIVGIKSPFPKMDKVQHGQKEELTVAAYHQVQDYITIFSTFPAAFNRFVLRHVTGLSTNTAIKMILFYV